MIRAFLLALGFLTVFPVPPLAALPPADWGRSVPFFPVIGAMLGLLLLGLWVPLRHADPVLVASMLLTVWVAATGGLHLDGLADCADAWIGGRGDRERTLALMKDPRSGPLAIVVVTLVLLLKFAALQVLLAQQIWPALLWAPVLGRAALLFFLLTLPYVRPTGLGAAFVQHLPRQSCRWVLAGLAAALPVLLDRPGLLLLPVLGGFWWVLHRQFRQRLGGGTGDTLGAACELTETLTLLAWAVSVQPPA